jgi:hypothetical protein
MQEHSWQSSVFEGLSRQCELTDFGCSFHLIAMSVVVGIVFGTCVVFVLHESQAA